MFGKKKEELPEYMRTEHGKAAALLELMPHGVSVTKANPERKYPDASSRGYTYCAQWKSLKKVYGYSMLEVLDMLRQRYEPLRNIGQDIKYVPVADKLEDIG